MNVLTTMGINGQFSVVNTIQLNGGQGFLTSLTETKHMDLAIKNWLVVWNIFYFP